MRRHEVDIKGPGHVLELGDGGGGGVSLHDGGRGEVDTLGIGKGRRGVSFIVFLVLCLHLIRIHKLAAVSCN